MFEWFSAGLVILYLIVFTIGAIVTVVGLSASLWGAFHPVWHGLRFVILIAAWFFSIAYGIIVLFWLNRAGFPEVLAYAVGCALAIFVIKRVPSAQAPRSAGPLAFVTGIAAGCIAVYAWGLYAGVTRGWSASGYFVAYRKCGASFDRCVESGPYSTLADCERELTPINGRLEAYDCIDLQGVPRAYLPWVR